MAEATQAPVKAQKPEAEKAKKEPRPVLQSVFTDEGGLLKEVENRTKGPRRAFKCTAPDGRVILCAANNEGRAGGVAFMEVGGKVEELGRKPRSQKPVGIDGIMQAINSLPQGERDQIAAQLKAALAGGAKK